MATESIGTLIPTAIPGYADAADIQAALRAYHYGSYTYDPANTSPASLVTPSMAKTIYDIQADITTLENRPSSGGAAQTSQPVPGDFTPAEIPNGYIWVDSDGTIGGAPTSATAIFTNSAPTSGLTTGLVWVDKDATSITNNPFVPQSVINAKGDILIGTANDTASVLSVAATNGYLLSVNSSTTSGLEWIVAPGDIQGVTASTGLTGGGTSGTVSLAVDTTVVATTNNTLTMSGKTLTSPIISTISNTGTLTLPTSTDTLVGRATTDTLTNKTLTSPAITGPTITGTTAIQQILETATVSATAATGTINYDLLTNGAVTYYTSNASANWTLNVRGSATTSLNTLMSTGQSMTLAFLVTQGGTAYYQSAFQIDGSSVTPKWQGGTAPTSGNTSSIDIYSITIIKTGNAAFTAFAAQTKFA
jgi:hypothetical protein